MVVDTLNLCSRGTISTSIVLVTAMFSCSLLVKRIALST
jgi:hypothetical protein